MRHKNQATNISTGINNQYLFAQGGHFYSPHQLAGLVFVSFP